MITIYIILGIVAIYFTVKLIIRDMQEWDEFGEHVAEAMHDYCKKQDRIAARNRGRIR